MNRISTQSCFIIAILGFWMIASTLTFGFQSAPLIYTNFISAILLITLGLSIRRNPTPLKVWVITAIGIWLQFSPLLFWAPSSASYLNDTFIGCWIIALAITLHPVPGLSFQEKASIPPGWSYNPSSWPQRFPIAFFAFICWMISRYLAAYQLGYINTVWDPFFNPGTKGVLESAVSKAFPVSDAGLGAAAYTLEFFSICIGGPARWRTAPWLVLIFGILVIPVSLVSTILIILQPLAVGTWCTLCLITAVCMLIPIPFAIGEVAATLQFLRYRKGNLLPLLFKGGECRNETQDTLSPSMDQPILTLLKASLSGVTFPWNLTLTSLLGVLIMAVPSLFDLKGLLYNLDPILGALTTVIAMVSFAEYSRKARWLNLITSLLLIGAALLSYQTLSSTQVFLHAFGALAIGVLTFRKGPIRERFSFKI